MEENEIEIIGSKNIPASHIKAMALKKKRKKQRIIWSVSLTSIFCIIGIIGILIATKHEHDYVTEITAPTCMEQGYTSYTCACGDSYKDNYTAALGHMLEWEIVTEATESANGLKIQKCSVCGEKAVEAIIPATASLGLEFTSKGDGTCYVSGIGTCTDTDIVIPSAYNGMRVTSIGSSAFERCTGLTSITIPDSVMSIGDSAFSGCTGLTSVTIPDSVTSIGEWAFAYCSDLTSIEIPDSMTSVGSYAFYECDGLTSIEIPDSVTSIGSSAFEGCSGLTSVTIPDSVTSIGSFAFEGCSGLTSVTIPDSVTSIGYEAFRDCSGLTSITFNGTKAQWNAIYKGTDWKYNVPATEVVCSDGAVSLG